MMERLLEYIRRPLPPFERGSGDCCAWAARWAEARTGILPGKELCTPCSRKQALHILRTHGGMAGLMGMVLERDGWAETSNPRDGDIAVIRKKEAFTGETVGVWSGGRLVSVNEEGKLVLCKQPNIIKLWTFNKQ